MRSFVDGRVNDGYQPLAVIGAFRGCSDRKNFWKNQRKRALKLSALLYIYINKPKQGCDLLRISRSSLPVKLEFTTLLLQMTTPQTRMNAGGLFTTLFACLRL